MDIVMPGIEVNIACFYYVAMHTIIPHFYYCAIEWILLGILMIEATFARALVN